PGALAQTPDEVARALGVPESYFAMRDGALRRALSGALFAVAMSERGAGSRLSALTTAYQPVDGGYRITGSKTFVSGAGHADVYLVAARAAGVEPAKVSYFLVPAGEGVSAGRPWAARLAVLEAARRVDAAPGDPATNRWVWRAKLLAGETAMEVAASMLEAAGTSATRRGHPLERIYRDARCGSLQPATSDVCADWLGMAALGMDPEND